MLEPTGPLPASVYWRRRAVAAGVCVLAVMLLAWLLGGLVGGADDRPVHGTADRHDLTAAPSSPPPSSPPASSTTSPVPTTSPAGPTSPAPVPAGPPPRCADAVLEVVARPDASSYPVGSHPLLSLTVVNTGKVPCTRDVSRALRELVITTMGGQRLWSSNDCYRPAGHDNRVLAPAEPLGFTLNWAGRTSAPGCPEERETVEAGEYRLVGKLGNLTGPATILTLTP